jgi:hypothetical protein
MFTFQLGHLQENLEAGAEKQTAAPPRSLAVRSMPMARACLIIYNLSMLNTRVFLLLAASTLAACQSSAPLREDIAAHVQLVSAERLMTSVETLCENGPRHPMPDADAPGSIASQKAVTWVADTLVAQGWPETSITRERFEHTRRNGERVWVANLVLEATGNQTPNETLELVAHWDSVAGAPGADDNATGVAALIEIARLMAVAGPAPRTVRFVFVAEEETGLNGSIHHLTQLKVGENLHGALVFDMIGYASSDDDSQTSPAPWLPLMPSTGDFVILLGNWTGSGLCDLYDACAATYVPELNITGFHFIGGILPDADRSDHWFYWENGFGAAFLSDTANFRNPHYHKSTDQPASLDPTFFREVTQAALATVFEWAYHGGHGWTTAVETFAITNPNLK